MLSFNDLLTKSGLSPAGVRLVRHTHSDRAIHRRLHQDALAGAAAFREFQEIQGADAILKQFEAAQVIAAFVGVPYEADAACQTVFVGLFRRTGTRPLPTLDSYGQPVGPSCRAFCTEPLPALEVYRGRLFIDWGKGARSWVQRADNQDKEITALLPTASEPPFPGYLRFQHDLASIDALPGSWISALQSIRGIYLLTHKVTKHRYVGSASGSDGLFGRWLSYSNGHGGNVRLVDAGTEAKDFEVAILEVVGSLVSPDEILAREAAWKTKLGTKDELNGN